MGLYQRFIHIGYVMSKTIMYLRNYRFIGFPSKCIGARDVIDHVISYLEPPPVLNM